VAPFLLRVWERQLKKKYKSYLHWPEFKEFWDQHCGVAGHAWEKVATDTDECFECGQQRDPEPPQIPFIDDEFYGCPEDLPLDKVRRGKGHEVSPKKSLLAKDGDWVMGKKR